METLLILTYASVSWGIFKLFKIPVNKWTLTTDILGGVAILGVLLGGMAYFHPASVTARSYFLTTPIVSNVRAKVVEVPVRSDVPLKKGDVLCKLDPTPFQARFDDISAKLAFAQKRLDESRALAKVSAGSKFDVEKYEQDVQTFRAQLDEARFNLESTVIQAPADGFVTHLRVQPGMMAVPLPLAPIMTFVHSKEPIFVAGFSQQPMQSLKEGNHAEVIFPGIPGRTFQARVSKILGAIAEGQLSPTAAMISPDPGSAEGLIPVFIEFEEDMSEYYLPAGSAGVVAVYSERWHHVTIIRKVLLRMQSWRYFAKFH